MITPSKITDYHRKRYELEEFLLFCVLCAGKSSEIQARKLEEFLGETTQHKPTPFEVIRWWTDRELLWRMKRAKLGKKGLEEKIGGGRKLSLSKQELQNLVVKFDAHAFNIPQKDGTNNRHKDVKTL